VIDKEPRQAQRAEKGTAGSSVNNVRIFPSLLGRERPTFQSAAFQAPRASGKTPDYRRRDNLILPIDNSIVIQIHKRIDKAKPDRPAPASLDPCGSRKLAQFREALEGKLLGRL